ncbi:hypothetical protein UA08_07102 [Talaromyces atroroseus]|uniref:SAP domain-containing protein n=1 Tax=Talaromyces atroroseus TaxID=1441469 RepID=A0A225AA89_TALAT|nr:hypothetical protein UA08_07102 [Talaromyces atroroseus]OKL57752.1 hypothetical protein UA08_07102 [Talaromyces atroroseus]
MADYSKWKVTELKAELKTRGVPQTGLRLKQDYVEKLIALDSESTKKPAIQDTSAGSPSSRDEKNEDDLKVGEPTASQQSTTESLPTEGAPSPQKQNLQQQQQEEQDTIGAQNQQVDAHGSEDASEKIVQAGEDKKSPVDHAPLPPDEPVPAEGSPETKIHDTEASSQAQEGIVTEEQATAQSHPADVSPDAVPPIAESVDDLRKRKRRSQSPPPSAEAIKKLKAENENPQLLFQEITTQNHVEYHQNELSTTQPQQENEIQRPEHSLPEPLTDAIPHTSAGRQDHRFRDLLPPPGQRKSIQSPEYPEDDDRQVEPALHPATSSIYIRNLMRPLQPLNLKNHLLSLAAPAEKQPDAEVLLDFFLDSIKTHCFAIFDSVSTASRVRSKLHGSVWPNERDRKPLWVDFTPEDKVDDWIKTEQDSVSAGRGSQRWEVVYEETGNGIEAILQEARGSTRSGHTQTAPARRPSSNTLESRRESQPSGSPRQERGGEGFKALDDRFRSTKTKPKLYYLPVSRDIVDKRLAQFDTLTWKISRHSDQGSDDTRRITFEDIDVFVDGGPEYRVPPQNYGGRHAGRGSWRGRRR